MAEWAEWRILPRCPVHDVLLDEWGECDFCIDDARLERAQAEEDAEGVPEP